jgi:hypothetical protein
MTPSKRRFRRQFSAFLSAALALHISHFGAAAQNRGIVGIWRFSAQREVGVPLSGTASFGSDGSAQLDGELKPSAEIIGSSGSAIECLGRYRFDGQTLQTSYFSCRSCSSGPAHCLAMDPKGFNALCAVQPESNAFSCRGLDYYR